LDVYDGWCWTPGAAIAAIWAAWILSWWIAALWTSRTTARPAIGSQFLYRAITLAAMVLLFDRWTVGGSPQLWVCPPVLGWAMAGLTAAGFGFCWWARLYLGRLWSAAVTRKEDHHIVDTGPYALVRHPIYTGWIAASAATAAEHGTLSSVIGLGLMILGCWIKARLEESFLRGELGAESYDAYARRTGMLLPFL
jgi:protein-S-isoprenylcysteine O-methyltransferase Ste14